MARIFEVKGLQARKQLLAAESDLRRETLRLQVQNLQLYAAGVKEKFNAVRFGSPLLLLAPALGLLFGPPLREVLARRRHRRQRWVRLGLSLLFSLRMYRRLRPFLRMILSRNRREPEPFAPAGAEEQAGAPAANI